MNEYLSKELCVVPHLGGVRLADPSQFIGTRFPMVNDVLDLPCNVAFLDSDSTIISTNEYSAEFCGFLSAADLTDRSVHDVLMKDDAICSSNDDKVVIASKRVKFYEHTMTVQKEKLMNCLSIKIPVYHQKNHVIGILGCTMIVGLHPLTQSLQLLNKLDLFSAANAIIDHQHFTQREREVLRYLTRGKSAKQIGDYLGISHRTVEHHIENMKLKSGCASKYELIDLYSN